MPQGLQLSSSKWRRILSLFAFLSVLFAPAHLLAFDYSPPLTEIETLAQVDTLTFKVFDPIRGVFVEDSVSKSGSQISRLLTKDGVVVWFVESATNREVFFAVYDLDLGSWQVSSSTRDTSAVVSPFTVKEGVVAWTVQTAAKVEVLYAVYDSTRKTWRVENTTKSEDSTVSELRVAGGIVAWQVETASNEILFAVYDLGRGLWKSSGKSKAASAVFSNITVKDEVVVWQTATATKNEVSYARYDATRGSWKFEAKSKNTSSTIRRLLTSDGIVTWWVESATQTEVFYVNYDSNEGKWKTGSKTKDATNNVRRLNTADGVVALWFDSPTRNEVFFAAYDTAQSLWKTASSTKNETANVPRLLVKSGVVAWSVKTASKNEVLVATYDRSRRLWRIDGRTRDGSSVVPELIIENGIVAWWVENPVKNEAAFGIYRRGAWRFDTRPSDNNPISELRIEYPAVLFTFSSTEFCRVYDGAWVECGVLNGALTDEGQGEGSGSALNISLEVVDGSCEGTSEILGGSVAEADGSFRIGYVPSSAALLRTVIQVNALHSVEFFWDGTSWTTDCERAQTFSLSSGDKFNIGQLPAPSAALWNAGACQPGDADCIDQPLGGFACVGANGFLGQVNVASVVNLGASPLGVRVEYLDALGALRGSVETRISPGIKQDFIVNDMGLLPDTVGTVCVFTDARELGQWTGGIVVYKPDTRNGAPPFGAAFDFALLYPFLKPQTGPYTLALNTFHLGVPAGATVANWISISDATPQDGFGVEGTLLFQDAAGNLLSSVPVGLPDGGRADFAGHDAIGGVQNADAIGTALFLPKPLPDGSDVHYYITVTRYFYECVAGQCTDFATAFNLPLRPPSISTLCCGASTVHDEISVVEVLNVTQNQVLGSIGVGAESGLAIGDFDFAVPKSGTQHVVMNQSGPVGFLATNSLGTAQMEIFGGALTAANVFYQLGENARLKYGYAAPMVSSSSASQVLEYNSFIEQETEFEAFNSSDELVTFAMVVLDFNGAAICGDVSLPLAPQQITRFRLPVPAGSYGTILLTASRGGLFTRAYVRRPKLYTLVYRGIAASGIDTSSVSGSASAAPQSCVLR